MEFGILGPLRIAAGDGDIELPPKQRDVLAMLLLNANRVVPVEALIGALWDGVPPPSARTTTHGYLRRLRQMLAVGDGTARISTRGTGYQITVADGELDLHRFRELSAAGGAAAAARDWVLASREFSAALDLWRGEALADVPSALLQREQASGLAERRLQVLESRIEAELQLGLHAQLVPELRRLISQFPLRERFHEQLMLALYRCGREAEALAVFRAVDAELREELGVAAGPALDRLHQRILTADPALVAGLGDGVPADAGIGGGADREADPGPAALLAAVPPAVVPRQLPAGVRHFTGRSGELAALAALAEEAAAPGSPVVVAVIDGIAGAGKSTLAVHFAHQVAGQFPDGQLYASLHGFGPEAAPAAPGDVVRAFLGALGIPAERIPASLAAQSSLYRSALAGKRMLILLDDAHDSDQVRPLLPGSPGCLVLITSRVRLSGLASTHGASAIPLNVLTEAEARQLLDSRLGGRPAAEPRAAAELIRLCGRLPLALSVAAARVNAGDGLPLGALVTQLRAAGRQLDALDPAESGDQASSVRAVFSWSYQALSGPAARLFRLLGLHTGPDLTVLAAASLAGVPAARADQELRALAGIHLVAEHAPGRFVLHDLLRAYAAERAAAEEDAEHRRAAAGRVLDYYLHTACTAGKLLYPHRDPVVLQDPLPGAVPSLLTDPAQALAWFDAERAVLLRAIALAAESGFHRHAWQLAWAIETYCHRRGRWHDWVAAQRIALAAAQDAGDRTGQAHAWRGIGAASAELGAYPQAQAAARRAMELFGELGNRVGAACVHEDLARMDSRQGRDADALMQYQHALLLFREAGDRAGQGRALNEVGWCLAMQGRYAAALRHCELAVAVCAEIGDQHGEAYARDSLGFVQHRLGNHAEAATCLARAVELKSGLGDRPTRATSLDHLGDAQLAAGNPAAAREAWAAALAILEKLRSPEAARIRAKLDLAGPGRTLATTDPRPALDPPPVPEQRPAPQPQPQRQPDQSTQPG